jgi:hypothetical protein
MIKKIDVPYYSQHTDIKGDYWQKRACGAICMKMVLDFYNANDEFSPHDFVQMALKKNAYGPSGWIHDKLIEIAKDSGVKACRLEFKPKNSDEADRLFNQGVNTILKFIDGDRPVIASAIKRWIELKKFHMVILTGYERDKPLNPSDGQEGNLKGFYYIDPDFNNAEEGKDLFVDIETFKKYWRRMAIFVG